MKVTKREAIDRQLNFAIKHYFQGEDIVPIFSIVGAAHIISHDLVEHDQPGSSWASEGAKALGVGMAEVLTAIRRTPNFLKHAQKDPDADLEVTPEDLEFTMFHIMLDIGELNEADQVHTDEVSVFQLWFIAKYKQHFTQDEYNEIVAKAEEHFPELDQKEYEEQLRDGWETLLQMGVVS